MAGSYNVALFVTCLVDMFRPNVGFAAVKLLEQAGCQVSVPSAQTCCGQPAYNSGDRADTLAIAKNVISVFEQYDYVVAPSGSCAGMIRCHYPTLFKDDPKWAKRAEALAAKTYELISFLVEVCKVEQVEATFDKTVTYHDSCSGLRELGVKTQPRKLLQSVKGCELKELNGSNECCGFGGAFCVKYPDVSNAMVTKKAKNITDTEAQVLLAGDLGCLMNMAGKLHREDSSVQTFHVAEVLADMADKGIGEGDASHKY